MPAFTLTATAAAPVEEVWKLLYDPARFPQWWAGVETVRRGEGGDYTMWPTGYPDFPMAQQLRSTRADARVTISCLVSDLEFRWQLSELGGGTGIEVRVQLPEAEAHRLPVQRELLTASLANLTRMAAAAAEPGRADAGG
jgi:uncharacterized protein YndB with AHSA1/START domain